MMVQIKKIVVLFNGKRKICKSVMVKSGTGKTYSRHSNREIVFCPGIFVVLILKLMVQIRKNVVIFSGKRKMKNRLLGKKWYWKNHSLVHQVKIRFFSRKFCVTFSEIYGTN
jgi:hypothetical protein